VIALGLLLLLICFGLWIFLKHKWTEFNKKIVYIVSSLSVIVIISFFMISFLTSKPAIVSIVDWYDIILSESLEGGNFQNNFIISDDQFASTNSNSKTLKVSSFKERAYTIFSDLKWITGDKILLWKFKVNWPSRFGFRLMNTTAFDSNEIRNDHFNECVLSSYDGDKIKKWYSHFIYKRWVDNKSSFQKADINEWIYYVLLKLSEWKISCYFQKEWNENYTEIIVNQDMVFENLGWPTMTRYIDDSTSFPELLEFKLYSKNYE